MDLLLNLTYDRSVPMFRRVSKALEEAIRQERLLPGESIPSVRDLSCSLKISRSTALKALEDLKQEGLLESIIGAGTFVRGGDRAHLSPGHLARRHAQPALSTNGITRRSVDWSKYGERLIDLSEQEESHFNPTRSIKHTALPISLLPVSAWNSGLRDCCQDTSIAFDNRHDRGYPPLLEALSGYLLRARSVHCQPGQVVICSAKQLRLDLIARLLIDPGDLVAVENPGFSEARITFESHGASVLYIPVDREGLDVGYLESITTPLKLIYITPSHQDPTGAVLSLERRKRLLEWARHHGSYIIEDDYDCEFRYGKNSLASLQGSGTDCVIYISSFWRVLFPLVTAGFIVVPRHLASIFHTAAQDLTNSLCTAEQAALASFINRGHLERHIRKTHKILSRRRQSLIFALTMHMRKRLTIEPETAGTHLLGRIDCPLSDLHLVELAAASGISVMSTAQYHALTPRKGELMISFSDVDVETISDQVASWMTKIEERELSC